MDGLLTIYQRCGPPCSYEKIFRQISSFNFSQQTTFSRAFQWVFTTAPTVDTFIMRPNSNVTSEEHKCHCKYGRFVHLGVFTRPGSSLSRQSLTRSDGSWIPVVRVEDLPRYWLFGFSLTGRISATPPYVAEIKQMVLNLLKQIRTYRLTRKSWFCCTDISDDPASKVSSVKTKNKDRISFLRMIFSFSNYMFNKAYMLTWGR